LGGTGDPVLIIGDIMDLKKEASTIAEVTVKDVKKDIFFQNQLLSKQLNKPGFSMSRVNYGPVFLLLNHRYLQHQHNLPS